MRPQQQQQPNNDNNNMDPTATSAAATTTNNNAAAAMASAAMAMPQHQQSHHHHHHHHQQQQTRQLQQQQQPPPIQERKFGGCPDRNGCGGMDVVHNIRHHHPSVPLHHQIPHPQAQQFRFYHQQQQQQQQAYMQMQNSANAAAVGFLPQTTTPPLQPQRFVLPPQQPSAGIAAVPPSTSAPSTVPAATATTIITPSSSLDTLDVLAQLDNHPDRQIFVENLRTIWSEHNIKFRSLPTISKKSIDLYMLYLLVKDRNGFLEVTRKKQWKEIANALGITNCGSAAFGVKRNYSKSGLFFYECRFELNNADPKTVIDDYEKQFGTNHSFASAVEGCNSNSSSSHHAATQQQQQQTLHHKSSPSTMPGCPPRKRKRTSIPDTVATAATTTTAAGVFKSSSESGSRSANTPQQQPNQPATVRPPTNPQQIAGNPPAYYPVNNAISSSQKQQQQLPPPPSSQPATRMMMAPAPAPPPPPSSSHHQFNSGLQSATTAASSSANQSSIMGPPPTNNYSYMQQQQQQRWIPASISNPPFRPEMRMCHGPPQPVPGTIDELGGQRYMSGGTTNNATNNIIGGGGSSHPQAPPSTIMMTAAAATTTVPPPSSHPQFPQSLPQRFFYHIPPPQMMIPASIPPDGVPNAAAVQPPPVPNPSEPKEKLSKKFLMPLISSSLQPNSFDRRPVDVCRIYMSLKCGLWTETKWALEALASLLVADGNPAPIQYMDLKCFPRLLDLLMDLTHKYIQKLTCMGGGVGSGGGGRHAELDFAESCVVSLSLIVRNLSFLPQNFSVLACCSDLVRALNWMLGAEVSARMTSTSSYDTVVESALVTLANIGGCLRLGPSSLNRTLIRRLLAWSADTRILEAAADSDANTNLTGQRLAIECMAKMSVYEDNMRLLSQVISDKLLETLLSTLNCWLEKPDGPAMADKHALNEISINVIIGILNAEDSPRLTNILSMTHMSTLNTRILKHFVFELERLVNKGRVDESHFACALKCSRCLTRSIRLSLSSSSLTSPPPTTTTTSSVSSSSTTPPTRPSPRRWKRRTSFEAALLNILSRYPAMPHKLSISLHECLCLVVHAAPTKTLSSSSRNEGPSSSSAATNTIDGGGGGERDKDAGGCNGATPIEAPEKKTTSLT